MHAEYVTCTTSVNAACSNAAGAVNGSITVHRVDKHDPNEKTALGARLAACRAMKGWKQDFAASQLGVTKAALSAWETGRNMPDALFLRKLSKLYDVSVDAILWDNPLSQEAMQFAAEFDGLTDKQRRSFKVMWMAYFQEALSDEGVEREIPITRERKAPTEIRHEPDQADHPHRRKTDHR